MIHLSTILMIISLLLANLNSCKSQIIAPQTIAGLEQLIQEEMDKQKVPALSLLIFNETQVKYEGYFGNANLNPSIKLTKDHLFLLASISKTVTATALLQLYDKGKFQLNDPINDYLPFSVHIPNKTTAITFQMLLTHTSGIKDGSALDDQYYDNQDSPIPLRSFLENYLVPNGRYYNSNENFYKFEPGTRHKYSNTGSTLIALLVEEISGLDFNSYCKQHIFAPMSMNNTFWHLDEIDQTIVQPYDYFKGQYQTIPQYTFTDYPNGGLRSNARDMFHFLSAFTQGGAYKNYQLLTTATINTLFTPQIPTIDNEMGLHLFLLDKKHNLWGHNGGEMGVSTVMGFNPITKIGILIFSNKEDVDLGTLLVEAYTLGKKL